MNATTQLIEILATLVLAMLLGDRTGLEREFVGKPAGLRTRLLVRREPYLGGWDVEAFAVGGS